MRVMANSNFYAFFIVMISIAMLFSFGFADVDASHNQHLYVSAENSRFDNHFSGSMVVEVVVRNPSISDTDEGKGEPNVTVNGKTLRMVQASDGNWYGYFADLNSAKTADQISLGGGVPGAGLDFGVFCSSKTASSVFGVGFSETAGIAVPRSNGLGGFTNGKSSLDECTGSPLSSQNLNNVVRFPRSINTNPNVPTGQIGLNQNAWPLIHLFSLSSNVVVQYDAAGGAQQVHLNYDDMPNISLKLDRERYPKNAEVFVTVEDFQLNQDPTSEDSWTFNVELPVTTFYQAFTSSGANSANGNSGLVNLVPHLSSLGFDDNGVLSMALSPIIQLQSNEEQPSTFVTDGTNTFSNVVTLVEDGPNSGVFENFDFADKSTIAISSDAQRGQSTSITYDGTSYSIVTGFSTASVSLQQPLLSIEGDSITPGTKIPIKLVDHDQNINSGSRDDLDVFRSSAIIPSLKLGNPITLEKATDMKFHSSATSLSSGISVDTSVPDARSDRMMVDTTSLSPLSFKQVSVNLGITVTDLKRTLIDPNTDFGTNWINYDIRSFTRDLQVNDLSDTSFSLHIGSFPDPSPIVIASSPDIAGNKGFIQLDDSVVSSILSRSGQVSLVINFDASDDSSNVGEVSNESTSQPVVFDLFSFGQRNGDLVNNSIYRFELEETESNSGIFRGTLEFSVINQLNQFDPNFIRSLKTIGDEIKFLVTERLIDEKGISVSYSDLAEVGVTITQTTKSEIRTHSGIVTTDKSTYRFGHPVTITLKDPDLNLKHDTRDIYTVIDDPSSPFVDTVGKDDQILLEVLIKDIRYKRCTINGIQHGGLASTGFSLVETGSSTGVFEGTFKMPTRICNKSGTELVSTAGGSLDVRYHDFRDASGETNIFTLSRSKSSTATFTSPTLNSNEFVLPKKDQSRDVILSGSIQNVRTNQLVSVTITAPDGSTQKATLSVTEQGRYRGIITLDHDSLVGIYKINLSHGGNDIGTVSFSVVEPKIPENLKAVARGWAAGTLGESAFLDGVASMIDQGIINLQTPEDKRPSGQSVPSWVKQNAKWWINGQISNEDFVNSIEYLIKKGIIRT